MSGPDEADAVVVGSGPAGLAAAMELKRRGVERVVVVERDADVGGVPRHCGHPPFGMQEFARVLTGPAYAARLAAGAEASGADIRTQTAVTAIDLHADRVSLACTTPGGRREIVARRLLLATGTRESPRASRLTSGDRPLGVLNTGALQAYAYLERLAPFCRPVIVGTELVALSAILTCRSIGARPVAMIEEGPRPIAPGPLFLYPRLRGIPVMTSTRIVDIAGSPRVSHVVVETGDRTRLTLECDGVVFSGRFVGEAHLARLAGLDLDRGTGGPEVDQFGRTNHPLVFAAGNLLRPVETAGWSFREGARIGGFIAEDLKRGALPAERKRRLVPGNGVKYVMPQWLADDEGGLTDLQLRVTHPVSGHLVAEDAAGRRLVDRQISALPERRILIPVEQVKNGTGHITVQIVE